MTDINDNAIIKQITAGMVLQTTALNRLLSLFLEDKLPVSATSLLSLIKIILDKLGTSAAEQFDTNVIFETAVNNLVEQYKKFLLSKNNVLPFKPEPPPAPPTIH